MKRILLTLALVTTTGTAYAQSMPSSEPLDPNGRPLIGRSDWVRQPGDQPSGSVGANAGVNTNAGANANADIATAPSGPRAPALKDEFGFRYDDQGNRLDARGNIISPQTR
ncbi:MAG: hypothetical protein PSV46_00825 [Reyranella sp.]|nr:hypothetical protein [Reyranella sp.]